MMKFISRDNLFALLDELKPDYEVFVPHKKGAFRFYQSYVSHSENIIIGEARTTEPIKGFFTPAIEKVAEDFNPEIPTQNRKPFAIVGIKACDLHGFLIQDHVFLKPDRPDPFYARAREDNLIISADCTLVLDTCFCLALGHKPYPESYFDINLSEVEGGFVVEVGSPKGQKILEKHASLFQEANPSALDKKEEVRKRVVAEVQNKVEEHEVPHQDQYQGMVERNYESKLWEEEAKRCVECGACTMICPTCHCFVLSDQKEGDHFSRCRQWDSCMFRDFARVAGGGNPRSQLAMRLRNRFEKKFDYFPKVANLYACTGCGRCISGCPANIDIRSVLKRMVDDE